MCDSNQDYISDIIDEIALEGLDGITLEALWVRLSERPKFIFKPLDEQVKVFLWPLISRLRIVAFYSLPVSRPKLVTFNRLEHVDSNGNFYEPDDLPACIYPHCPIEDKGIMGSCSTYKERVDVTKIVRKEPYDVVLSRGNKLVIVADQMTRNKALCSMDFNPLTELGVIQYCILERIGRSRYQGEVTQGKRGLQVVTDDPKMLYYFRKLLVKNKLVVKQLFYMRVNKQTSTGSVIHLPRFFTEIKTRQDADALKLVEFLEAIPQKCIPLKSLKPMLNIELKKLLSKYPKNFKNTTVPYRVVNPSSKPSDWKMKSNEEEKKVRVVMLLNPNLSKDEEEDEDDEEEIGLMDESQRRLDRCLIRQAYSLVEQSGPRGIKQSTLGNLLAVPSLQARSICKHLVKKKLVRTVLIDMGRQRISHFYCTKFESSDNSVSMEVLDEKTKLLKNLNLKSECSDENTTSDLFCASEESVSKLKTNSSNNSALEETVSEEIKQPQPKLCASTQNAEKVSYVPPVEINENIEEEIIIKPVVQRSGLNLAEEVKSFDVSDTNNSLTARMLKRANLIIQAINLHKVIQDYQKINKLINEEEETEGLKQTVDRKTVQRLVDKLVSDGVLRIIRVNLKGYGKEKNMVFICHPSVTENHSEIQSAIDQAKMKLPIVSAHHTKKSLKKNQDMKRQKPSKFLYDKKAGRKYGFKPKFIRMQIFHVYMYYLIYGYDGDLNLNQSCKEDIVKKFNLEESFVAEMSTLYRTEVDWKMFLPPLPAHAEYPEGWCLLSDVILRLPLWLFVSIVNVPYDIPGLLEYVRHPIRKFFLVKHLPAEMFHHLTLMRKYIFTISEIVFRLAYIGLTQLGPQKLKEKDQIFIYLNRNAILYNTIPSDSGYNQISKNKSYERISYHFTSIDDLEAYWYDLWNFAMNTNLGIKNGLTGQSIVVESVDTKKELLAAVQPKTVGGAKTCDVGYLPGDRLGAAGLDSDLFVFLKRNWYYWSAEKNDDSIHKSELYLPAMNELYNKPLKWTKNLALASDTNSSHRPTSADKLKKTNDLAHFKLVNTARKSKAISKKKTRIVEQRKTKFARKPYYDQKDKDALSRMVKLRVDWSPSEDNLLLICKVASLYLSPNKKRYVVKNFFAVREILHSTYSSSRNKTSRACQRRIRYMMKNPSTAHSVNLCLEEVKQDPEINDNFHGAMEKLDDLLRSQGEGPQGYQQEYDKIFISLVKTLFKKLKTINSSENTNFEVYLPDTVAEFIKKYEVIVPRTLTLRYGAFQEVQRTIDILASVINSVIHSSLACTTDKTNYSQQLFYIYQQYPDRILRSVMAKCRAMSVVSCRRKYKRWKTAGNDCLPLASSPYQLSITYMHILQTKYQYNIFSECYDGIKTMLNNHQISNSGNEGSQNPNKVTVNIDVTCGGECANIVELFSAGLIDMLVEFPDQLIVLDPRLSETEESYKLIMKRFREMLAIVKDARTKEKKSFLIDDSDEEEEEDKNIQAEAEGETYFDQFNLKNKIGVANAASRLALYLMRDEPLEHLDHTIQHAHDFFVLNPCKVTANLNKTEIENMIFFKEKKSKIIAEIKRSSTFPVSQSENDIINHLKTKFAEEVLHSLLKYLESKGELGSTFKDIKENFIYTDDIDKLLLTLVDEQMVLKSGVISTRYIHYKYVKPWLVKSFYLLRLTRENKEASNTNSSYTIAFGSNISPEKKKLKQKADIGLDCSERGAYFSEANRDEPPVKKIKSDKSHDTKEMNSVVPHIHTDNVEVESTNLENTEIFLMQVDENIHAKSPIAHISSINKEITSVGSLNSEMNEEPNLSFVPIISETNHELSNISSDIISTNSRQDAEIMTDLAKNQEISLKEQRRFLMKTTKRKWVIMPQENCNKFTNFDTSDVKHVNVLIRPWIKIDRNLNRRVLDRMLGSVLGHCLTCPGISILKLQERFIPALQPAHTFELVEILKKIGCISLITIKKSWNCSLFSKRATTTIVPSLGLESASEILINTDPLAISKLGYFIGDKSYSVEYLDALAEAAKVDY